MYGAAASTLDKDIRECLGYAEKYNIIQVEPCDAAAEKEPYAIAEQCEMPMADLYFYIDYEYGDYFLDEEWYGWDDNYDFDEEWSKKGIVISLL